MSGTGSRPLLGLALLARGRPEGLAQFGSTEQAFLASLAPLIAFSIVGAALTVGITQPLFAFVVFLVAAIAQLAPPVLSHMIAVRWGREEDWLRYATAFNWCQCLTPIGVMAVAFLVQVFVGVGMPAWRALEVGLGALILYMLWLNWLVARHGLDLSRGRAATLVLFVILGSNAMVVVPAVLAQLL